MVLLDEPFASLDAGLRDGTRRAVADALRQPAAHTTVLVTHDQAEALSMADQVAVMRDRAAGPGAVTVELYRDPADVEPRGSWATPRSCRPCGRRRRRHRARATAPWAPTSAVPAR